MAIVIEEQKQKSGWVYAVSGVIVGAVLVGFTWWLFFTSPPRAEVLAPPELEPISRITQLKTNPSDVLNSPTYKLLKQQVGEIELGTFGRENPFARF